MRCQFSSGIASTAALNLLDVAHADRVLPARPLQQLEDLRVPEPAVGPQQLGAGRARPLDARDQLLAEALDPLLRVRRSLAEPDVQRLAGVGTGGEDRVIPEHASCTRRRRPASGSRRPRRRSCRHRSPAARRPAGAGLPGALDRPAEQRVELAHVPERERAQKRPQRRWRRQPATRQPPRAARPQHVGVVDAVGARAPSQTAAPSPCGPRSQRPADRAAAAPAGRASASIPSRCHQRRDQRDPRIRDDPLIVETDPHAVQSDRPRHPAP